MPKSQRKLRVQTHLYMEPPLHDKLVRLSGERQMSRNELMNRLIEAAMKPPADHTDVVLRRMERLDCDAGLAHLAGLAWPVVCSRTHGPPEVRCPDRPRRMTQQDHAPGGV